MKTITIKSYGLGRYDDVSPFILADRKLELKFSLPIINGQFFFVAENNEKKFKLYIPDDRVVILHGLTAGELKAEIKHYIKGELIASYKVEPLLLREVDSNLSGTPEIVELQNTIAALRQRNGNRRSYTRIGHTP